ncbi:hypothetical protein PA598K_05168 [Paenibacillus sp. 598K]|uniref:copper amine oxidase N-terminal domain-containing protein n=1 Tax=Paenibacillus sp. 598K TaxID=1117987 RepID=UPI000FF90D1F|nr:copper amine oxidase N-terminal domain-containing protein [Paenibacillus sp. 598K]GBF76684.1 hypothetical protein PA598K_05168 [Paenibacillus sp. 598K]
MGIKRIAAGMLAALMLLSLLPLYAQAQTTTAWPDPEWVYENEELADAIQIDSFRAQIAADALYFFADHRLYIVDTTTGKLITVIEYLKGSNFYYEFFGSYAEIGKDGSVYAFTAAKNDKDQDVYTLHAYSQSGEKRWQKTYSEKIRSLVGLDILSDGTILAYLETGSEQYVSYRYDRSGRLLEKKQWTGAILGYQNGYLVTARMVRKGTSRFSFYDDQMRLKFSHELSFDKEDRYAGVGPDGQMYLYRYNESAGTTTYSAVSPSGKVVWSKQLKGEPGRDSLYDHHHPGPGSFAAGYAGSVGGAFFFFDPKGNYHALPSADFYFQTASDGTILQRRDGKLDIYQTPGLKRLYTAELSDLSPGTVFLYEGQGIVYTVSKHNVLQKLDLYHPPIRVYVNGEKQQLAVAPQNIDGTVMLPLRDSVAFLGGNVQWQGGELKVKIGDREVTMRVGDRRAQVNGSAYTLTQPPALHRGHTMIPVRFMSEALGAKVRWSPQDNSIYIEQ